MYYSLSLRQYCPADTDRVRELHEAALRATGGFIEGTPEPDLDADEAAYLADGEFLDCSETTAERKRLRVDPDHQHW